MKLTVLLFVVLVAGAAKADDCGKLSDTKCAIRGARNSAAYAKAVANVKALHPKVTFVAERAIGLATTDENVDYSNQSFLVISEYRFPEAKGSLALLFEVNINKRSTDAPIDITVGEVYDRHINLVVERSLDTVKN